METRSEWLASPEERAAHTLDLTLAGALARAASLWPDGEAIVYRHQPAVEPVAWTYAQLDALSGRLATALLRMGLAPGERIAIWGPNHPEWVLLEYAAARAGLVIVALNPLYRVGELHFALADCAAAGLFYADTIGTVESGKVVADISAALPGLRHTVAFSKLRALIAASDGAALPEPGTDPDATFMVQYTSGTTGKPRAVRLSHRALTTTGRNSYECWGIGPLSRVCFGFPLFHVGGSGNSIPGACLTGASALPLHIFKARTALDVLERERCTTFIGVPTMIFAMLEEPSFAGRDWSALEAVVLGGAPVTRDLLALCRTRFGADVVNCYGQTETSGVTATTRLSDSADRKTATSGRPLAGVSVAIRDEAGAAVPRGETGELFYSGPGGMTGYGAAESDPAVSGGWIASGDLARMDEQGFVTIVGRRKEMIIRGGENLSPVEIESYMREHEAIADVAVVGVPDARYGEVACAVVRLHAGCSADAEAIRGWCAQRISRWKVPEFVEFVDSFPMTASGKIQKFLLRPAMAERLGLVPAASASKQEEAR